MKMSLNQLKDFHDKEQIVKSSSCLIWKTLPGVGIMLLLHYESQCAMKGHNTDVMTRSTNGFKGLRKMISLEPPSWVQQPMELWHSYNLPHFIFLIPMSVFQTSYWNSGSETKEHTFVDKSRKWETKGDEQNPMGGAFLLLIFRTIMKFTSACKYNAHRSEKVASKRTEPACIPACMRLCNSI